MFRQSVRRAMKGVTTKLEQVHGMPADTLTLQKLSAQIGTVVQQLAEVVHKLHLVRATERYVFAFQQLSKEPFKAAAWSLRATDTMLHCICVKIKAAHTYLERPYHILSKNGFKNQAIQN